MGLNLWLPSIRRLAGLDPVTCSSSHTLSASCYSHLSVMTWLRVSGRSRSINERTVQCISKTRRCCSVHAWLNNACSMMLDVEANDRAEQSKPSKHRVKGNRLSCSAFLKPAAQVNLMTSCLVATSWKRRRKHKQRRFLHLLPSSVSSVLPLVLVPSTSRDRGSMIGVPELRC